MTVLPSFLQKYLVVILGLLAAFFVVNILLLDYFFVAQRTNFLDLQTKLTALTDSFRILKDQVQGIGSLPAPAAQTPSQSVPAPTSAPTAVSCPASCVSLINSAKPSSQTISPVQAAVSKGEYFIPLGAGSVSQTNNWTDIPTAQATFDAGSYGTIKAAYFEVILHVASGEVHARLFDVTTPAIFWTTDLKSTSYGGEFLSAPITLLPGNKTYKVQMYSSISSGVLDQARIRVVTQ